MGAEGDSLAEEYYPLMKRFLGTYVGDGSKRGAAAGPCVDVSRIATAG